MNPYQPDDRVRRKTDGALGTFRRQDPDGRVVVRWDGDGVDFTAEPWDLEQAPSGELTDADLDALTKAAEGRGGLWREVAAMTAELRARRAQDTPSDPAAWTHPDEEEESDVQRALACAHGPDEAVSGWPTVARVLAVEVERLRALVRAPGAVAPGDPAVRRDVEHSVAGFLDGLMDEPTGQCARDLLAHLDDVHPGWLRAPGAVAAAPTGDEKADAWGVIDGLGYLTAAIFRSEDFAHDLARKHDGASVVSLYRRPPRLTRLLVRDRVALARVKTQRDRLRQRVRDLVDDLGEYMEEVVGLRELVANMPSDPPAPSAGEDEAAVERAARAIYAEVYPGWPWEDDDDAAQGRDDCRRAARAAFAAARGPRTQDDR